MKHTVVQAAGAAPLKSTLAAAVRPVAKVNNLAQQFITERLHSGKIRLECGTATPGDNGQRLTRLSVRHSDLDTRSFEVNDQSLKDILADNRLSAIDKQDITAFDFIATRNESRQAHPHLDYKVQKPEKGPRYVEFSFTGADYKPKTFKMDDATLQTTLMRDELDQFDRGTVTMALHYLRITYSPATGPSLRK
jgi:hypothetical protein